MSRWLIELLDKRHKRDEFDCGEEGLNVFLRTHAGQDARRDISRTYVAVHSETGVLAGYYTLSSGSVVCENLPDEMARRLPKYPVPVAHLGRLAVDVHFQGKGLGGILLVDALKRARSTADQIGVFAVTVHALNARAKQFYEAHGFLSLLDDGMHMFLPMATIRKL